MNDLISVIVPIYKVEDYLDRCIKSIVGQSYNNLEIILVDDGSPDRCPELCDRWAERDSRIKVIHQDNRGLSEARNAGLEVSTGDYIGFVDGDDLIHREMYGRMYHQITEDESDMVSCGIKRVQWGTQGPFLIETPSGEVKIDRGEECQQAFVKRKYGFSVCTKLYRASIVGGQRFHRDVRYGEDMAFNAIVLKKCAKISRISEELYYYCWRSDSMVAVRSLGRVATLFGAYEIIRAEYPDDVMMRRWVCRQIMMTSSHALIKRDLYSGVNGQIMGEIHGELRRNFNVSVVMKMERPKERVQVVLAYFCPTLGWTLSKMWRGGKRLQGRK